MTYPDPRVAEAAERSARGVAEATQAPPADLPNTVEAYAAWLRNRPAAPARPSARRSRAQWLDPDQFRQRGPRSRVAPAERSPAYGPAADHLATFPDFGVASLERARTTHPDWPIEQLVIHAAANPITPRRPATTPNDMEHPAATTAACATCGTALDPDGTCLTCQNRDQP